MPFTKSYGWVILPLLASLMLGCEQEIDIELDEADRRIVIEGWVTDQPGPYVFKVTRSFDFFGEPEEDFISGATLVVKDDMGTVDTLEEVRPGYYETGHLQGMREHTYTLEASVEGEQITAVNYLPRITPILAAGATYTDTLIFGEGYYVTLLALEPAGIGDYYQFRIWRNDSLFNQPVDLLVTDDRFVDGQLSPFLYPYPHELGDTIVVEVRAISNLTYDFFLSIFQQSSGGGPFGSPPANLVTNITSPALGFFGAAATERDTIIIQ